MQGDKTWIEYKIIGENNWYSKFGNSTQTISESPICAKIILMVIHGYDQISFTLMDLWSYSKNGKRS